MEAMREKCVKWVRGSVRLPGLFTKVKWRNADGGNIPLGEATPLEHYSKTGANINWHEWLDETGDTHLEAVEFAEWKDLNVRTAQKGDTYVQYYKGKVYSYSELYNLFKQSK